MSAPRMTMEQMTARLDALVLMRAGQRLHQAKAVNRRSEAEELDAAIKATRDLLLDLTPHKRAIWALMQGQALAPVSDVQALARDLEAEGGE